VNAYHNNRLQYQNELIQTKHPSREVPTADAIHGSANSLLARLTQDNESSRMQNSSSSTEEKARAGAESVLSVSVNGESHPMT
jgi:hypothetical protein